ncbi:Gp37 [Salmonella enterica subsp. arizonae]|uniref:Gp37 n=1 Tax=Salmonella enterica subsp. arizonae TaxID=59203 RepID=A0A2X4T5P9_SALER|nr:hypothetical protein [Salmonella enterica]SQI22571.1 Gp37 [Salmonella enterica subsp. arizonae]
MTTISNNKLPEWRKTLNKSVENYQSMRAWYEENGDNPAAGQDMDAAEGDIEKLIKQYGVLIVLNLLDEILVLIMRWVAIRLRSATTAQELNRTAAGCWIRIPAASTWFVLRPVKCWFWGLYALATAKPCR